MEYGLLAILILRISIRICRINFIHMEIPVSRATCDVREALPHKGLSTVGQGIRVPLPEDRRIFTPIDRASYKWRKEYDNRTAVERGNSRLDVSFGFELHTIRGMGKMKSGCGLAMARI